MRRGFAGIEIIAAVVLITGLITGAVLVQKKETQSVEKKASAMANCDACGWEGQGHCVDDNADCNGGAKCDAPWVDNGQGGCGAASQNPPPEQQSAICDGPQNHQYCGGKAPGESATGGGVTGTCNGVTEVSPGHWNCSWTYANVCSANECDGTNNRKCNSSGTGWIYCGAGACVCVTPAATATSIPPTAVPPTQASQSTAEPTALPSNTPVPTPTPTPKQIGDRCSGTGQGNCAPGLLCASSPYGSYCVQGCANNQTRCNSSGFSVDRCINGLWSATSVCSAGCNTNTISCNPTPTTTPLPTGIPPTSKPTVVSTKAPTSTPTNTPTKVPTASPKPTSFPWRQYWVRHLASGQCVQTAGFYQNLAECNSIPRLGDGYSFCFSSQSACQASATRAPSSPTPTPIKTPTPASTSTPIPTTKPSLGKTGDVCINDSNCESNSCELFRCQSTTPTPIPWRTYWSRRDLASGQCAEIYGFYQSLADCNNKGDGPCFSSESDCQASATKVPSSPTPAPTSSLQEYWYYDFDQKACLAVSFGDIGECNNFAKHYGSNCFAKELPCQKLALSLAPSQTPGPSSVPTVVPSPTTVTGGLLTTCDSNGNLWRFGEITQCEDQTPIPGSGIQGYKCHGWFETRGNAYCETIRITATPTAASTPVSNTPIPTPTLSQDQFWGWACESPGGSDGCKQKLCYLNGSIQGCYPPEKKNVCDEACITGRAGIFRAPTPTSTSGPSPTPGQEFCQAKDYTNKDGCETNPAGGYRTTGGVKCRWYSEGSCKNKCLMEGTDLNSCPTPTASPTITPTPIPYVCTSWFGFFCPPTPTAVALTYEERQPSYSSLTPTPAPDQFWGWVCSASGSCVSRICGRGAVEAGCYTDSGVTFGVTQCNTDCARGAAAYVEPTHTPTLIPLPPTPTPTPVSSCLFGWGCRKYEECSNFVCVSDSGTFIRSFDKCEADLICRRLPDGIDASSYFTIPAGGHACRVSDEILGVCCPEGQQASLEVNQDGQFYCMDNPEF